MGRNLGDHGHGAALRSGTARRAGGGDRAARPLEDHDVLGRAPSRWPERALRLRRRDRLFDPGGARFLADVEQALAPILRKGDIGVLDNLKAHKVDGVRQAIAAAGAQVRYLPPYSPDFAPGSQHRPPRSVRSGAPIEQAFAKLKALLRTAARRTVDALWRAIGHALDAFSPAACTNYFAHAGYVPSNREAL
jgi:transposase